jgi:heterotetrameric sarcosine oxidase delta subunit
MRITCPHCGPRDLREFSYLGDGTVERPDPNAANAIELFTQYVYLRNNTVGPHTEFWYHGGGCQVWLVVKRDTLTHEIIAVRSCKAHP